MRGTLLAAFAVAAMVLVAGCTGSGGPADGGETTPAVDGTTTAPDGTATRTPAGGEDGREGAGAPRYTHFDFEEEESYRYDVMLGDERGTLLWEVREVDGDRVTVHLEFDFRATFETTVTGDRANIRRKLADTQFGELVTSGLLSPYDTILQDRTLELGERWSATTTEGSANVTVTETNTYAGVECQTTEVRVDGEVRYTACLSPRLGLVVHSSVTPEGEAGGTSVEFELVEVGTGAGGTSTPTPTPTPTATPTSTVTPAPTATLTSESGVWRVRVEYDGRWSGTVTVTTDRGRSTRAFTGDGDRTIDVDVPLDVDPQDVRSITATAEKRADDGRTLRVIILKNGEIVAEASTDAPSGDTVASHHD